MRELTKVATSAVIITILFTLPLWASNEWKEVKNKKGIIIETRVVEGSPMKEFRAACNVDAPIEVVWEIVKDAGTYANWFGDCLEKKVVQKIDEKNEIGYQVVNVPLPFRDRDTVAAVNYETDIAAGKAVIKMDSIGIPADAKYGMDEYTKEKKRVRMPKMNGIITLTRMEPNKTKMIYQAHADPGVALPGWVLNLFSTAQPFKSLKGIQKEVKKKTYYEKAEKRYNKKFTR